MSNLANFKEACEWLREWEAYRSPITALRAIKRAAVEQRANYEACARAMVAGRGGALTGCGWHGDPMVIEDARLRLLALRDQSPPRLP